MNKYSKISLKEIGSAIKVSRYDFFFMHKQVCFVDVWNGPKYICSEETLIFTAYNHSVYLFLLNLPF